MKTSIFCLVFLFVAQSAHATAKILVISNLAHKVQLHEDLVKEVFLGTRTIADDWRFIPLDQEMSSPIREEFYLRIAGKTPTEMKIYWAEQIFSGKARAPRVAQGDQGVIHEVESNPNAIGYVTGSVDTSKVNVVLRLE